MSVDEEWDEAAVEIERLDISMKNEKQKAPPMVKGMINPIDNRPVAPSSQDEIHLDSAILSAMSNQRERMVLFQIEQDILKFVESNERTMEISAVGNSFRRLLAYRVGQRFGLSHATSDFGQNGERERGITLYKMPTSAVPKQLLIDMPISAESAAEAAAAYGREDENGHTSGMGQVSIPISALQTNASSSASAQSAGLPKKMQVMKRKPGSDTKSGNEGSSNKQQQSAEDREKAYLEARARIFGEAGDNSNSSPSGSSSSSSSSSNNNSNSSSSSSTTTTNTTNNNISNSSSATVSNDSKKGGAGQGKKAAAAAPSSSSKNNRGSTKGEANPLPPPPTLSIGGNSKPSPTSPRVPPSSSSTSPSNMKKSGSSPNLDASKATSSTSITSNSKSENNLEKTKNNAANSTNKAGENAHTTATSNAKWKKKVPDVASWKTQKSKSQIRNIDAERSDPDFDRRSSVSTPPQQMNLGMGMGMGVMSGMGVGVGVGGVGMMAPPAGAIGGASGYQQHQPTYPMANYPMHHQGHPQAQMNYSQMNAPMQSQHMGQYGMYRYPPAPMGYEADAPTSHDMLRQDSTGNRRFGSDSPPELHLPTHSGDLDPRHYAQRQQQPQQYDYYGHQQQQQQQHYSSSNESDSGAITGSGVPRVYPSNFYPANNYYDNSGAPGVPPQQQQLHLQQQLQAQQHQYQQQFYSSRSVPGGRGGAPVGRGQGQGLPDFPPLS